MRIGGPAIAAIAAAFGCGRLAFDPVSDAAVTSIDSPAPDAPGVAPCGTGPTTLCNGQYLFCDGFETSSGGSFPPWNGVFRQNWNGGFSTQTDCNTATAPVCRGSNVLSAVGAGNAQLTFLRKQFAARPNPAHARIMVNIPTSTSIEGVDLLGWDESAGGLFMLLNYELGSGQFFLNSNFAVPSGTGTVVIPRDQWVCVEIEVFFAATNGRVQVSVDGAPVLDTMGMTQPTNRSLDTFEVGISTASTETNTLRLLFDEVVVSSQRIGCGT